MLGTYIIPRPRLAFYLEKGKATVSDMRNNVLVSYGVNELLQNPLICGRTGVNKFLNSHSSDSSNECQSWIYIYAFYVIKKFIFILMLGLF